jgi:hypothetical protein
MIKYEIKNDLKVFEKKNFVRIYGFQIREINKHLHDPSLPKLFFTNKTEKDRA